MKFLEKNLEDIIFENPRRVSFRGLYMPSHLFRQVRIGNYGVCDLIGFSRQRPTTRRKKIIPGLIEISIYELKKDVVNDDTFAQVLRYAAGLNKWLEVTGKKDYYKSLNYNFIFYLNVVGSEVDTKSKFIYLPHFNNDFINFNIYEYSYEVDGIRFSKHGEYYLINEALDV